MTDPTPRLVYKLLTAAEMAGLEASARFDGSDDDRRDGFIHLATAAQLDGVVRRHFSGQTDLYLAAIDVEAISDSLRWEASHAGERFPHLYAPLTLSIVTAYSPLERHEDGSIRLPVTG